MDEIQAERKRQLVNKRIMRREMERNPSRKFFPRSKSGSVVDLLVKGFPFAAAIKAHE